MMWALLKQEWISLWKALAGGMGAVAIVVLVVAGVLAIPIPIASSFMLGMGIGATIAIQPMIMGLLAYWYWNSMYRDQGYFTMAIPVRGRTLFWVKVIFAELVAMAAMLLTVASAAILMAGWAIGKRIPVGDAFRGFQEAAFGDAGIPTALFWFFIILLVVQVLFLVIEAATIMSVGAEARFNRLGFGAPVIGAIIYYFVFQVITLIAMLVIPVGMALDGPNAGEIVGRGMWQSMVEAINSPAGVSSSSPVIGLGFVPVWIVIAALMAWWGARSVDRRTSLR